MLQLLVTPGEGWPTRHVFMPTFLFIFTLVCLPSSSVLYVIFYSFSSSAVVLGTSLVHEFHFFLAYIMKLFFFPGWTLIWLGTDIKQNN